MANVTVQDSSWENIKDFVVESRWIDMGTEWLETIVSKGARAFLTAALVWDGAKITTPLLSQAHPTIDSIFSNGALLALDGAAIGLLRLAGTIEDETTASRMRFIAKCCFGLMIFNFAFSGAASYFQWKADSYGWLVILLLIARGILTVNYILITSAMKKEKKLKQSLAQELKSELHAVRTEVQNIPRHDLLKMKSEIEARTELTLKTEIEKIPVSVLPSISQLKTEIEIELRTKIEAEAAMKMKIEIERMRSENESIKESLINEIETHFYEYFNSKEEPQQQEPKTEQLPTAKKTPRIAPPGAKLTKTERARLFVEEQRAAGHEPGIEEIKNEIGCSDGIASAAKNSKTTITEIETELIEV